MSQNKADKTIENNPHVLPKKVLNKDTYSETVT